jgi:gliding motility-associated-like protein
MRRRFYYILFLVLGSSGIFAQCFRLNDGNGNPSFAPYWVSCSGGNFTLFLQSPDNIGAYTVNWGDGSAIQNGGGLVPPAFISHTYTATVDTFVVTMTETSSGCIVSGVVVMEGVPSASIQIPAGNPIFGCTPALFNFQNATTNTSITTRFTWSFGDGTPIENYDNSNAGQTISHTYQPGTTNCNTAVTLTAENYCNRGNPSINIYQPIQVWDIDDAGITPTPLAVCFPNNTFLFQNTSTLNCFAFGNTSQRYEYWNFGNYWGMGHDSIITWQPFNPPNRPGYSISFPGTGAFTVMLIDSSYCGRDTTFATVNILAPPIANFTNNPDTVCQGEFITFTNTSTGGFNYSWNFGDGTAVVNTGSTAPLNHTFNNSGNFNVILITSGNGQAICRDTITRSIFVKPSPLANFVMDNPEQCDSGRVNFTDFSQNAVQWNWTFGNGNTNNTNSPPEQFYPSPADYPVTLTVIAANNCTGSVTNQVHIYQSPQAVINTPSSVCLNTPTFFTENSVSSPGDPVNQWIWQFGDGSPNSNLANPSHIYSTAGTFTVILSVSTAHCSGKNDTIDVTVRPLPVAQFNQDFTEGCTPLVVNFTDASQGAIDYRWNFGDGTGINTNQNPTHSFFNPSSNDTTFRVYEAVQNQFGCVDTAFQNIDVFSGSHASFTTNAIAGCSPVPVNFTNTSTGAISYSWNFGDGSPTTTTTNPSHQFVNNTPYLQNYIVTLTTFSANNCLDSFTSVVSVYPMPNYNVNILPSAEGCHPLNVNFTASSSGVIYNWNFGDGDSIIAQNPFHQFTNTGTVDSTYIVTLIATNAFFCSDTTTRNILVHPLPQAIFNATPITQKFPSATVSIENLSVGGVSYLWQFGDNSPNSTTQFPSPHTYATWGIYTIQLEVTNSSTCTDTTSLQIVIEPPKPIATFIESDTAGCRPLMINFNSSNSQYAEDYFWTFGDGGSSNQANPSYTYHSAGNFPVTLIVSAIGGQDTATSDITVYEKPEPFFTVNPPVVYVPSDPLILHNLSTYSDTWLWRFGDGTSSTTKNPIHHYATKGKYTITLIASNEFGCSDSISFLDIVTAEERGNIIFPNAFTPSPEGPTGGYYDENTFENKVFFPSAQGVSEYHLMIFNRWGELIFESKELNTGWDGYYKGKLCPQDVYVWKVKAKLSDGTLFNKAGDVTLLR